MSHHLLFHCFTFIKSRPCRIHWKMSVKSHHLHILYHVAYIVKCQIIFTQIACFTHCKTHSQIPLCTPCKMSQLPSQIAYSSLYLIKCPITFTDSIQCLYRDSPTRFPTSSFFHHLNQPRPLTNGLKYFRFWLSFHRVIRIFINLPGV